MSELATTGSATRSFCSFRLGGRLHGIEAMHVREISPHLPTTVVPQAPPAVYGLVNLRSRIYVVLDLRPLLRLARVDCTATGMLLILKPSIGQDLGIFVEQSGDIIHVRADQIEQSAGAVDSPDDGASSLIAGVCKLDSELMSIVDPTRIIDAIAALFDQASR